jgi:hypothetical protein
MCALFMLDMYTGVILGTFVLSYMGNSAINFIMTNGNKLLAR